MLVYAVILVVSARAVPVAGDGGLLVHAPAGTIRGVPAADGDYVKFLGIPYARVNASNPFGAPIPQEKFGKVFDAFNESAICPQIKEEYFVLSNKTIDDYDGDLDCLRLNIFVPKSKTRNKATYIFIFGGNFVNGHSDTNIYGPKNLVRHDIIMVTFNYRSGPYGFMCMDIPEIPGNQGLRDQYAAIEWVRDNIGAFGGDPQKLTIGGHSSGSMLVDMHLLTARPRQFQQAILQSGTATNPSFLHRSDPTTLVSIARQLGFKTNDTYSALSFLAEASPKSVIEATEKYVWGPCVEKKFDGVAPFITEDPELSDGRNLDGLKILGGFTDRENMYSLYWNGSVFNVPNGVRNFLIEKIYIQNESDLLDIVHRFYVDDDADNEIIKFEMVDMISDINYIYPIQRQMTKYSKHINTSVYLYMFTYDGYLNRMKYLYNIKEAGATHSDELGYMFATKFLSDLRYSKEQRMIDRVTTLWTNFIKYGNPTPVRSELLPVSWPPLTADTMPCLQIGANLTLVSRPFRRRMAFWELFFDAHLDKILAGRAQE
ncbi:acetylcholinesterase-like [Aricia agestis]|uniref:acetylcholinesterase-like n=1 Tax=Aricia agestis TaxID=91739 RepID=UPI001C209423|nr:acetylcholinesterase-like [Aricia agestis]